MLLLVAAPLAAAFAFACRPAGADPAPVLPYQFEPADSDVTEVHVAAPDPTLPRISPRLFSEFLEHLGGAIYEGLWANAVYNPSFAREQGGGPIRWTLAGGASVVEDGPSGLAADLPESAEARQLTVLPAHRERRYRGSAWLSAPAGPSLLEVRLRLPEKPGTLVAARIRAASPTWARVRYQLDLPPGSVRRGEAVELVIACLSGRARVSNVELFPADAVDGMDPDIVRASRDLKMELLRWPGGNFASGYHWRSGVGPRERRPTVPNPAWWGLETHHFGTDEFMRFCRATGAKPQICVNAGDGTPEEAAAWVEYCNGAAGTPMGRLRAANGHPRPYSVRVWEIGNELYGSWQIGHTDPAGNAARFVRFRQAMLRVDPSIEVIATGKGDQYVGAGLEHDRTWNAAVLDAARADASGAPAYLSVHPLVPLPSGMGSRFTYEQIYDSVLAHPQWWGNTAVPELRGLIPEHAGPGARTQIAPTEWGIIVGGPGWDRYPNHNVMSGALYAALWFHAMFRTTDVVGLSNVTALLHGGGIARPRGAVIVYPMYHVQRLYSQARPTRLLPVRVSGPSYSVPQRGLLPAEKAVPYLDVVAAEGKGGRCLFVANRDRGSARRGRFTLPSAPVSVEIETLAADPQAGNTFEEPDAVRPRSSTLPATGTVLDLTFPPCSVSVVRLR